jgi:AraC family transcriptional regulator of adaptative response / DNA-3-methyladenine glycosylase II
VRASARVRERGTAPAPTALPDSGVVHLRLPARPPFDAAGVFAWLTARTVAGVEESSTAADGRPVFRRTLRLPSGPALIELTPGEEASAPSILVTARLAGLADLPPLVARVRRLFDLDADAVAIDAALASDPVLAASVAGVPGMRVPGCLDPHELVFRALVGQQVSVAAARTALGRLAQDLGEHVDHSVTGAPARLFPTAAAIAEHGEEVLRGPAARIRTIIDVANRLAAGDLVVAADRERHDLESQLLEIPGIGPWTAGYVAMRVTGAPDVLLTGDLALRNGAANLGLPHTPRELAATALRWAPWRSYASMHLWRAV